MVPIVDGISKLQMAITLLVTGWIAIGFLVKEAIRIPARLSRMANRLKEYFR